jgi:hypothetical protein
MKQTPEKTGPLTIPARPTPHRGKPRWGGEKKKKGKLITRGFTLEGGSDLGQQQTSVKPEEIL